MRNFLIRLAINALALMAAAAVVPGVRLSENVWGIALVALVFGIVNAIIKPLTLLLTFPVVVLTLGLFTLVINALMLMLTAAVTRHLAVDGFWAAFLGSLVISLVSMLLSLVLRDEKKKRD